jgi:hypothetical protein
MGLIAPQRVLVHPNRVEPELIVTIAQPSGFMEGLGGGELRQLLDDNDKQVYINHVDVRTAVVGQQAAANMLPSATITLDYVQTLTYLLRTRQNYNELDVADAGTYNVSLPSAYQLASRQGIYQAIRALNLYGMNASNSEGLINAPNSTAVTLPPDPFGNTTLQTYDNGALAVFLLGQIQGILQRMFFLGGSGLRVVFEGPQRVIAQMQMQNIVQVTSYQRPGAGTATTAQVVQKVADEFDIEVEWAYDDTLIGKGAGSTVDNPVDALLLLVPEAIVPKIPGINTNEFAKLSPTMNAMTMQYTNVAAPIEITTPIAEGLDVVSMQRVTSGWAPRGQAVSVLSIPF